MSLILVIFCTGGFYKEYTLETYIKANSIIFYFHENHLEHKLLSVRQKYLQMENLHAVVREF